MKITDPDAYDRLCEVEGASYRANDRGLGSAYSFASHLAAFAQWEADVKEAGMTLAEVADDPVGEAIYGASGYHRYIVRGDGRIVFSRYHATAEGIAKALAAGFDVR